MNSANYNPQEMWNAGCQLGEWEQQERGWAGGHGGPGGDEATQLSRRWKNESC